MTEILRREVVRMLPLYSRSSCNKGQDTLHSSSSSSTVYTITIIIVVLVVVINISIIIVVVGVVVVVNFCCCRQCQFRPCGLFHQQHRSRPPS